MANRKISGKDSRMPLFQSEAATALGLLAARFTIALKRRPTYSETIEIVSSTIDDDMISKMIERYNAQNGAKDS
jgi:hypothetical protein